VPITKLTVCFRTIQQRRFLHKSFLAKFRGGAVTKFAAALHTYERLYRDSENHGRTIVITQSSGTGKSRLMFELAKEVRSILFSSYLNDLNYPL
jgi:hypothetical protein